MSRSRHQAALMVAALVGVTSLRAQNATPAPDLSDPEVAHVAVTANSIDIDMATFAQTRTHNAAVKQFAQTMIPDHTPVNPPAPALAQTPCGRPAANAGTQSLHRRPQRARACP